MLSNLSEEYKEKLKTIKNHFGEINQKAKLLEELEEAENEIADYAGNYIYYAAVRDPNINIDKLLEEIVDCCVVAYQIDKTDFTERLLEDISDGYMDDGYKLIREVKFEKESKILEIARQKIDRTLERIESGYYEPDICPICYGAGGIKNTYDGHFFNCKTCNGTGKVERKEK